MRLSLAGEHAQMAADCVASAYRRYSRGHVLGHEGPSFKMGVPSQLAVQAIVQTGATSWRGTRPVALRRQRGAAPSPRVLSEAVAVRAKADR